MRPGVPEQVGIEVVQPDAGCAALEHQLDPGIGEDAAALLRKPQARVVHPLVAAPNAEVLVEDAGAFPADRDGPQPSPLPENPDFPLVQVEVFDS